MVLAVVVAPEGALQSRLNAVVVASGSVDVEPRVPVAMRKLSGAKSSQPEVLTLVHIKRDFPPSVTDVGLATSVAYGFAGVVVAVGGVTGGFVGCVCCVGAGCVVPKSLPSSCPRVLPRELSGFLLPE